MKEERLKERRAEGRKKGKERNGRKGIDGKPWRIVGTS